MTTTGRKGKSWNDLIEYGQQRGRVRIRVGKGNPSNELPDPQYITHIDNTAVGGRGGIWTGDVRPNRSRGEEGQDIRQRLVDIWNSGHPKDKLYVSKVLER